MNGFVDLWRETNGWKWGEGGGGLWSLCQSHIPVFVVKSDNV